MKFDCPNGVKLEVAEASGVTVRVLPDGSMQVDGRRKGGGLRPVAIALSMACAVGIGFVSSDLLRQSSDSQESAAAEHLARYPAVTAPRIQGAEPPEWLRNLPTYAQTPPTDQQPPVARPRVEVPAPSQAAPSQAVQSPFGLDAP